MNTDERPLVLIWEVTQACELACEYRYVCEGSRSRCHRVGGDGDAQRTADDQESEHDEEVAQAYEF